MNTKLTLTLDADVISMAKTYAQSKGRSLSEIVETYLRSLTAELRPMKPYTQVTSSLQGAFREPENFDYKKELENRREDKYLK